MKFHYHLADCPPTYDFLNFLVACDILRERLCAPSMEIAIGPGQRDRSLRDKNTSQSSRAWRTYHLLPEIARLMPTVSAVSFGHQFGLPNPFYIQKPVPERTCFRAPEYALDSVPFAKDTFITMTVRQSGFQPERNTDPTVWNDVLKTLSLPVVVVPDTEAAMAGEACVIEGKQYAPAAFSPALRLALYEKAALNLFTTGGPMSLAMFSEVNAESFGLCVPVFETCGEKHLTELGLTDGATFQRSVFHWNCTADLIKTRVAQRIN